MKQLINLTEQTVLPGENVLFDTVVVYSKNGVERLSPGSGQLIFQAPGIYLVEFSGNIAVPTGETVGEISLSFALDGEVLSGSRMRVTPAAVEEFFNVATQYLVRVPCNCCARVAVKNTSTIPVLVDNANLLDERHC